MSVPITFPCLFLLAEHLLRPEERHRRQVSFRLHLFRVRLLLLSEGWTEEG
jgi:hypothetical protein